MQEFTTKDSIVRKIWGRADMVLFIFAGAAAEFALNKAVDWLYYTGKLPADPIGRLFSTVTYAKHIIFSSEPESLASIDRIAAIHAQVEKSRGSEIPDWAYRDVLYMLIHYSIASFELLERPLTLPEKQDLYAVFYRVGNRMGLSKLPSDHPQWMISRETHLENDLILSGYSLDLLRQYRKHLGGFRYRILLQAQRSVVPPRVRELLDLKRSPWFPVALASYKKIRNSQLGDSLKNLLIPERYKNQVKSLDVYLQH
jgi:uncharacterized protein (DUF2236 family)